jgi:chromosome partitioning protein
MAKYLLIPTKSDISSRKGIGVMARRFINMRRRVNPGLMLLGVLLFAFSSSASTVEDAARAWIEEALGAAAPVFKQKIRAVERQAFDTREQGLLSFEMSQDPKTTMGALAGDYHALSREVFVRLAELEAAA